MKMTTTIEPKGYHRVMQAIRMWQNHDIPWKECLRYCDLTAAQSAELEPIKRETEAAAVDTIIRRALNARG